MLPGLIVNDPDPTMCNRHDNKVPLSFQIKIAGGWGRSTWGLHFYTACLCTIEPLLYGHRFQNIVSFMFVTCTFCAVTSFSNPVHMDRYSHCYVSGTFHDPPDAPRRNV